MSDRLLAEAWRDLAGWHVGMVTTDGNVVIEVRGDQISLAENDCGNWLCSMSLPSFQHLPALDSPANRGHWLTWFELSHGTLAEELRREGVALSRSDFPAEALCLLCEFIDERVFDESLPPSVLAWWKSQQGEVIGG